MLNGCRWVVASAGTGKTSFISDQIEALLKAKESPSSILCLTFTCNAAIEMANRYKHYTEHFDVMPRFETIHAFAKSFIDSKYRVVSAPDHLIQEAIEYVISSGDYSSLFDVTWESWLSLLSDIKNLVANTLPARHGILNQYLSTDFKKEFSISMSKRAIDILNSNRLKDLVAQIESNDLEIYSNFFTKEYKLHKKYTPEDLISPKLYPDVVYELTQIFKKIASYFTSSENFKLISESIQVNEFINQVRSVYQAIKSARNLIDFQDIIVMANNKISEHPDLISQFRHIFLDEAQDINEAQWDLVYNLCTDVLQAEKSSVTVVGDPRQIIYEFHGASLEKYDTMKEKFKNMSNFLNLPWHEIVLNKNYRNSRTILDFSSFFDPEPSAESVLPMKQNRGYIKMWAPIQDPKQSELAGWKVPGPQAIPKWIDLCVAEIKSLLNSYLPTEKRRVEPKDITILIPRRCINIFILIEELKNNNIPIAKSPFNIITDETVQEILAVAEVAIDPTNDLAVAGILRGAHFSWSNSQLEDICINRETTMLDFMNSSDNPEVQKVGQVLNSWLDLPQDALTFYSKILFHTEYGATLWEQFPNETLIFWERVIEFSQNSSSLSEFIDYIKMTTHSLSSNLNGVTVSTIHAAKGSQSKIVFLCNSHTCMPKNLSSNVIIENLLLLKGNYSLYKTAKQNLLANWDSEYLRLLYVAITRAEEQLYITPPMNSETINSKSWYAMFMQNIDMFKMHNDAYELGDRPQLGLTRASKYR